MKEQFPELVTKAAINTLILGGGGREHALAWKLSQSARIGKLYVAPGNAGTGSFATNLDIDISDHESLGNLVQKNDVDLIIVGPDDALAQGVVDYFDNLGVAIVGPNKKSARIESSKPFAKELMKELRVPTADFKIFDDAEKAHEYIDSNIGPVFIKAGGLAQGKAAKPASDQKTAHQLIDEIMVERIFGDAGKEIVIEQWLNGVEVSMHAVCSGDTYLPFPASQDHKSVFDGDKGPNTGGMGAFAPVEWFGMDEVETTSKVVIEPILKGLDNDFQGLIYPGLMITPGGPKVIEYNARFGDPETQVYMRLLKSDLLEVFVSLVNGELSNTKLEWSESFAICIVAASAGYPGKYEIGKEITGLDKFDDDDRIEIFHAGTSIKSGNVVTNGGRVFGLTVTADSLEEAREVGNRAMKQINFAGIHYRTDIGSRPSPHSDRV